MSDMEMDKFYGLLIWRQSSIQDIDFALDSPFVNSVSFNSDQTVDYYSDLKRTDTLYVAFHGALRNDKDSYPRFERVSSLTKRDVSFLSFADPTWHLANDIGLSWFLGGPKWDAIDLIETVVRQAMIVTAAQRVVFVGGSGGGYAALRIGLRFPGSLAYVQSPQTVVTRYIPEVVDEYFDKVWGRPRGEVAMSDPRRFDLTALYRQYPGSNYVYYLQNLNDPIHIRDHYRAFKNAHGLGESQGTSSDGTKRFYLSDSELLRHGPPTPLEFDQNFFRAMRFYAEVGSS